MDLATSGTTMEESAIVEEQNKVKIEIQQEIHNICNDIEISSQGEVKTAPLEKEKIEILNVELVAPQRDDYINNVGETTIVENGEENVANFNIITAIEKNFKNSESNTNIEMKKGDSVHSSQESIKRKSDETETPPSVSGETLIVDLNDTETDCSALKSVPTGSGLSLLAQYDSDDSVIEVPSAQDYRNQVVEIGSESDSDISSDSSNVECLKELRKTIDKRIAVVDEDEEDEDDNEENKGKKKHLNKLRVKGEMLLEDLPPIQDLQITVPEDECIEFGKIHSIVDQLVLVSALPNSILLDLDTVIFLEKGQKVLGEVFDVLGQVAEPLYCVRFNSNKQIKEKEINIGDLVYVAPKTQYTQYIILSKIMTLKGSDASWENDMEPPPRFLDYSDDEQEQLAKRQIRNKDRPIDNEDPAKRSRNNDTESISNRYNSSNADNRNRQSEQRNNRGAPASNSYGNTRQRYNEQYQNQEWAPNHHRSSWHSNYYPQSFPSHSAGMHGMHNHSQTQSYSPHVPVYAMPPVHNLSYPPPQPLQYGMPPNNYPHGPQLMSNAFGIRPPPIHGAHQGSHQLQYTSTPPPPPPPGSQ